MRGWTARWFGRAFHGALIEWVGDVDPEVDRQGPHEQGPLAAGALEDLAWEGHRIRGTPLRVQLAVAQRRGRVETAERSKPPSSSPGTAEPPVGVDGKRKFPGRLGAIATTPRSSLPAGGEDRGPGDKRRRQDDRCPDVGRATGCHTARTGRALDWPRLVQDPDRRLPLPRPGCLGLRQLGRRRQLRAGTRRPRARSRRDGRLAGSATTSVAGENADENALSRRGRHRPMARQPRAVSPSSPQLGDLGDPIPHTASFQNELAVVSASAA